MPTSIAVRSELYRRCREKRWGLLGRQLKTFFGRKWRESGTWIFFFFFFSKASLSVLKLWQKWRWGKNRCFFKKNSLKFWRWRHRQVIFSQAGGLFEEIRLLSFCYVERRQKILWSWKHFIVNWFSCFRQAIYVIYLCWINLWLAPSFHGCGRHGTLGI